MLRAKQLDSVVFGLNALFIKEEMNPESTLSEMNMSTSGTHIVYEAKIYTPYITLESRQYGFLTEAQMLTLIGLRDQLDTTFTLTYDTDATETVRFAKEKKMVFTPLFEGSCDYTAIIPLAKVE